MTARQPELVRYLLSEAAPQHALTARRFFGGWQLLSAGRQFAIVMKGTLFFKVDGMVRDDLARLGCEPFSYRKSGTRVTVPNYMSAPEGSLDDPELLHGWVRRVIAAPDDV